MKKFTLFTSTLLLTAITLRAQTKNLNDYEPAKMPSSDPKKSTVLLPETKPLKPTYRKVVVIPVEDFQALTGAIGDLKETIIYNPNLTGDQSREMQKQIAAYLKDLPGRVKLDSVKVEGGK